MGAAGCAVAMVTLPGPQTPQPPFGRTRHPYFMHEMIRRQAVAARGSYRATAEALASEPFPAPTSELLFVGQGTSYHAALAAGFSAERALGAVGRVSALSSFDLLEAVRTPAAGAVGVVFSAGADTAATVEAQKRLREQKVRVLLVTSHPEGPSHALADRVLLTQYADETSWTHTVSFTAALVTTTALVDTWSHAPGDTERSEEAIGDALTAALATENPVVDMVERFAPKEQLLLVGSGEAEPSAREAALKLREASGRFCAAVGVEELLHGVLPSVTDRTGVLAISSTPLERDRALQGLHAARLLGAETLLVDTSGGPGGERILSLPPPGRLPAPVLQVVPFQLLAYWLAVSEGRNPDVMGLEDPKVMAARSSFGI